MQGAQENSILCKQLSIPLMFVKGGQEHDVYKMSTLINSAQLNFDTALSSYRNKEKHLCF